MNRKRYRDTFVIYYPTEEAKRLTILYGHCIVCGRFLKAGVSVERGIGPVCFKYL